MHVLSCCLAPGIPPTPLYEDFYSVEIKEFRYGNETILNERTLCIVDLGTTAVFLPSEGYKSIKEITGSEYDSYTGLLKTEFKNFDLLKPLELDFGFGVCEYLLYNEFS